MNNSLSNKFPRCRVKLYLITIGLLFLLTALQNSTLMANLAKGRIKFDRISLEHGLSQSIVNCILQDNKGYLWLGTQDGLNRYDGYSFKIYTWEPDASNSLTHSYIRDIIQDQSGIIWIGTDGGGLNRFDPKTESFSHFINIPTDPQSLSHNSINSLLEDRDGNLWIGTHGNGLNRFNPGTGLFTRFVHSPNHPGISHNYIYDIIEDVQGFLWLGTDSGLDRFNPKTGEVKTFISKEIYCLCLDHQGLIWIGTCNDGFYCFDPTRETSKHFQPDQENLNSVSHATITQIFEDRSGMLWIGTRGGGLNLFNPITGDFTHYLSNSNIPGSLSSNIIRSIYQDRGDILWIGTHGGGLNKFNPKTSAFKYFTHDATDPASLPDNMVISVLETDQKFLWVGTGSGLTRYNLLTNHFTHYQPDLSLPNSTDSNRVKFIRQDLQNKNLLWLGTNNGLHQLDTKNDTFIHFTHDPNQPDSLSSNLLSCLYPEPDGQLWVGTIFGGLNHFNPTTNSAQHYLNDPSNPNSLSHNFIYFIHKDQFNIYWIGTYEGLNAFDPVSHSFQHYFTGPGNSAQCKIISICEDHNHHLWIGTLGGGLVFLEPRERTFRRYSKKEGLANNVVYGILEDNNYSLWLSTNQGLFRFNPNDGNFIQYDDSDGLQSNEFNISAYHRGESGQLYFGGIAGLTAFSPDMIKHNPHIPPVTITAVQKINRGVNAIPVITNTDELILSYDDYMFTIEFSSLDFSAPSKNRYAYKLEGFNTEWVTTDAAHRSATYTNLDPGDYLFRVKGSNNHDVWNETPATIHIKVLPPFWKSVYFRISMVLSIFMILYFIFRLRMRSIKKKKETLELLVDERTKSLKEKTEELELFNRILKSINAEVELTEMLESVLLQMTGFLGMEKAAAFFYHQAEDIYLYKAGVDWAGNECHRQRLTSLEISHLFIDSADEITHDIFINRSSTNENINLVMVIRVKDNVAGYLVFSSSRNNHSLDFQDLSILEQLKEPLVSAFGRAILMLELKAAHEKAEKEQEAAEIANRTKSDFLARMSHEIRTPMNSVIGFTDMLMETNPTEEQIDYIRTINRSGEALLALINDILDFSKVESGMLTLESIEFDPVEIAYDVCKLVQPRLENKPIELICRLSDDVPPRVKGDPGRFRQVLVNLIGNAIKFTESGEIECRIDVDDISADTLTLHTKVLDTGMGIPIEKLNTIFQRFQQGDGSTSRKYGGSGLGLAICRQLSQLMNGNVWAESIQGIGSTFHFIAKLGRLFDLEKPTTTTIPPLEQKNILLADDNQHQLEIISRTLEKAGAHVSAFQNSTAILDAIRSTLHTPKAFDILIIDTLMPPINYQLIQDIRSLAPTLTHIPILGMVTSLTKPGNQTLPGFDAFIYKPFPGKELVQTITLLLKGKNPLPKQEKLTHNPASHTFIQSSPTQKELILLVEDNPINQKLAVYILSKAGYPCDIVENGKEAIDKITASPGKYDLVLMDIQTPVMDGIEAIQIIRKHGFLHLPVIAMTAQSIKGDRERCLEAGMNDYISKPIRKDILLSMIRKWTTSSRHPLETKKSGPF